jgi:hypothetical protein
MKTFLGFASIAAVVAAALLLHGAGHASSPFAVALANAAVKCPNITDATAHGLPAGSAPTATLSDRCVLDFGIPAGAKGDTGAAGIQGVAGTPGKDGVSGYGQVVSRVNLNSSKSNVYRAKATCPVGKKAIGGGAEYSTDRGIDFPNVAIAASEPTPSGQGWSTVAINLNSSKSNRTGTIHIKVTAVCIAVS